MAFTGRATNDSTVFASMHEDVSDIIGMIAPSESPLLDVLGDATEPATNVYHEWLEEDLNPNTIIASSTTIVTTDTAAAFHYKGLPVSRSLQVGAILKSNVTGEVIQLTGLTGNTLTFDRGFGGTTRGAITIGDSFFVISDAALEGSDVSTDISQPRPRKGNYTQIFKKDVIVSGTQQAVSHIGVTNEMDHQKMMRAREAVRDLEKAVINGILSGNTIGTASLFRTMRGIWSYIQTNVTNLATTTLNTLTPVVLNNVISAPWGNGATDLDLVVVDPRYKTIIDGWNETKQQIIQNTPQGYVRRVTFFEGTYGQHQILLDRWMPSNSLMVISTNRIKVVPMATRSFNFVQTAKTGDSEKGMVLGEYTLELKNEEGMAKAFGAV